MPVETVLIIGPAIDFTALLNVTHEALGYDIAAAADASPRKLSDAEKFLVCLPFPIVTTHAETSALTSIFPVTAAEIRAERYASPAKARIAAEVFPAGPEGRVSFWYPSAVLHKFVN
jgi:hypothetical protein